MIARSVNDPFSGSASDVQNVKLRNYRKSLHMHQFMICSYLGVNLRRGRKASAGIPEWRALLMWDCK